MVNKNFYYTTPINKSSDLNTLRKFFPNCFKNEEEIIHLHSCRAGPFLSNDIYLSIKEYENNPSLKKIIAVIQPYGPVSRYLDYWTSGFDDSFSEKLIEGLKLNLKIAFKHSILNSNIINDIAENYFVKWNNLITNLFLPIYREYSEKFRKMGFIDKDLQELFAKHSNRNLRFDKAIIEMSSFIINRILRNHGLPVIIPYFPSKSDLSNISFKFVNKKLWIDKYRERLDKIIKTKISAINQIIKKLGSYNRKDVSDSIISKVLENYKNKKNSPVSKFDFDIEGIRNIIKNKEKMLINLVGIKSQLALSLISYKKIISKSIIGLEDFKVIDGKSMIEICFRIAKNKNKLLILQSLMRGRSYKTYKDILPRFSNIKIAVSSCSIWNLKEFPDFDKNIFFGLDYLL